MKYSPWTDDEVASLNAYQACGYRHPFTHGDGEEKVDLIATREGWVAAEGGPVVQNWAHVFMSDWAWQDEKIVKMLSTERSSRPPPLAQPFAPAELARWRDPRSHTQDPARTSERFLATLDQERENHNRELTELASLLGEIGVAALALVDTLPRCTTVDARGGPCRQIATRAWARGGERYCDLHGYLESDGPVPEYPRAAPLRALLKLLGREPRCP